MARQPNGACSPTGNMTPPVYTPSPPPISTHSHARSHTLNLSVWEGCQYRLFFISHTPIILPFLLPPLYVCIILYMTLHVYLIYNLYPLNMMRTKRVVEIRQCGHYCYKKSRQLTSDLEKSCAMIMIQTAAVCVSARERLAYKTFVSFGKL